jgi:hypothetical protein
MELLAIIGCVAVFVLGEWGLNAPPLKFSSHAARIWGVLTCGSALALLHKFGVVQVVLDAGPIAKPMETAMLALLTILTAFCAVLELAVLLGLSSDD